MDSQNMSIQNQEDIYASWIKRNSWTLYKYYIDDGISGTKAYKRI